jgi:lipid-A-disaccharide synthase
MPWNSVMLLAGEPSGDALASELVHAFKSMPPAEQSEWPVRFFGAGGPAMAAAGVDLEIDLTRHAVFGLSDALRNYLQFRRLFNQLLRLAFERRPDLILLVDYGGFNRRFARAIRNYQRRRKGPFNNWNPKIIYYVSPQVWASRSGRAKQLEKDLDLLLSIVPFEKQWYAKHAPKLRVEFVGHPIVDRYDRSGGKPKQGEAARPLLLLLPGSRRRELQIHLPLMLEALRRLQSTRSIRAASVLPHKQLLDLARSLAGDMNIEWHCGNLPDLLSEADLAIASSGTVTLECAYFRLPTVVIYKTSWLTYAIGRRIIQVEHIAMPNLLAGEKVYPELIQNACTPEAIASEAQNWLDHPARLETMNKKLDRVIASLGPRGASRRAAAILRQELFVALPDTGQPAHDRGALPY